MTSKFRSGAPPRLSEANRPIRLRLGAKGGARDDLLLVKHVSGVETICGGIEYRLLCVAATAGLPLKQLIAMPVEVQFVTDTGGLRSVCGIVDEAVEGESDGGPPGEAVHCDEQGRVQVRFPGLRREERAGSPAPAEGVTPDDSAWLRPKPFWAGARFGAFFPLRVGTMCRVSFHGNDPDKPIIPGAVHGGTTPPPSFSHVSRLPGDRYLSGIVSQEIGGVRSNQVRLDDSPGQISIQVGSDHCASQLNLQFTPDKSFEHSARSVLQGAPVELVPLAGGATVAVYEERIVTLSAQPKSYDDFTSNHPAWPGTGGADGRHSWTGAVAQAGKVVAAGRLELPDSDVVTIARFQADGRLDETFGKAGMALLNLAEAQSSRATSLAVVASGRLLVAGIAGLKAMPRTHARCSDGRENGRLVPRKAVTLVR